MIKWSRNRQLSRAKDKQVILSCSYWSTTHAIIKLTSYALLRTMSSTRSTVLWPEPKSSATSSERGVSKCVEICGRPINRPVWRQNIPISRLSLAFMIKSSWWLSTRGDGVDDNHRACSSIYLFIESNSVFPVLYQH